MHVPKGSPAIADMRKFTQEDLSWQGNLEPSCQMALRFLQEVAFFNSHDNLIQAKAASAGPMAADALHTLNSQSPEIPRPLSVQRLHPAIGVGISVHRIALSYLHKHTGPSTAHAKPPKALNPMP